MQLENSIFTLVLFLRECVMLVIIFFHLEVSSLIHKRFLQKDKTAHAQRANFREFFRSEIHVKTKLKIIKSFS